MIDFKKQLPTLSVPSHVKRDHETDVLSPVISLSTNSTILEGSPRDLCPSGAKRTGTLSIDTINATVTVKLRAKRHTHDKRLTHNC